MSEKDLPPVRCLNDLSPVSETSGPMGTPTPEEALRGRVSCLQAEMAQVQEEMGQLKQVLARLEGARPIPPVKRKVTRVQREYQHANGALAWIDEPSGVGHIWTYTGREHTFEVYET